MDTNTTSIASEVEEVPKTKTDARFEESIPNYYVYGKEIIERKCWKCGERFETRLEMNKFCGPKCKESWLSDAFGKLRSRGTTEGVGN